MSDPRLERPYWRNRTNVDALTIAALEYAEKLAGCTFLITQGSYQSSVAESAGTHDRGGALDLAWTGDDSDILALRKAGFAAWHRTPEQGPWKDHIHAIVVDHPDLSPSAARQVVAYRKGRNGLANDAADDGPRLNPIPVFDYNAWSDDMPYTPDELKAIVSDDAVVQAIAAAVVKRLLSTDLTPNDDENDRTVRAALNKAANLRDEQKKTERARGVR